MTTEVEISLNKGAQDGFVRSDAKFPAFMGGFRSGKTVAALIRCWFYSMEHPGSRGVWTEPVAAMFADVLLPTLRKLFGTYEGSIWQETGKGGPNHQIQFSNGCVWLLKAAETPERLVGFEVAWALMDEAASTEHGSQEDAYLMLVGRLSQQGFPHWLGGTSTPGGLNWIWREGGENPQTGRGLFEGSSLDNPHLEDDYKEELIRTYIEGTPMYDQFVRGKFVVLEGLVLPPFQTKDFMPWPDDLFIRRVAGVDFAPQSPTAIVECAVTETGHRWMKEWLYQRDCDDEVFVHACRDAMDAGVTLFVGDPSGRERIQWMNNKGIPTVKARSNIINRRVMAWRTPLGQEMLTIERTSQFLIREVVGLSWAKRRGRERETDRFDVNTPDHAFDAGAYALMEIEAMPIGFKPPKIIEHGVLA